jgi:hypothetical protein
VEPFRGRGEYENGKVKKWEKIGREKNRGKAKIEV